MSVTPTIRTATPRDLPAMAEAKRLAGLAAWPHILPTDVLERLDLPQRWEAAVRHPGWRASVLVAELDHVVVGFSITRPSADEDASAEIGELDGFYTTPAVWGLGAGRALLEAATRALREAGFDHSTLWTASDNHRPRRIYERAGWLTDGTRRARIIGGVEFTEVRYRIGLSGPTRDRA